LFTGDMIRNEAYREDETTDEFRDCIGPGDPGFRGPLPPDAPVGAMAELYCNTEMIADSSDDEGEHYNIKQDLPPVFALPMLPRVGLRFEPVDFLAIKAEAAFGIVAWWVGASIHFRLGALVPREGGTSEPMAVATEASVGRVLGRVVETGSGVPVAGATITLSARALSPLQTMDDGRFIVDRLDPGEVTFEIEREGYVAGECRVTITEQGGDVPLSCELAALAQVGALSGLVKTEKGKPIGGAVIEIEGPKTARVTSAEDGSFGAVDLPAGTYRLRVDAEEYLMQMLEIDIEAQDTATPKVILIKKPKRSLVTLSNKEIVISQQVRFETNSAEIVASSDPLLREIADVMLRNPHVEQVEIQGHTDNTGSHERNMTLSQERADAVRAWLVNAGVAEGRLEAKGYGPDHPLGPNKTAADRARNRRVQLIIRKQSAEVSDEREEE
jgi:outer membrane protein OmpA-like peptidoglycan-associated protein